MDANARCVKCFVSIKLNNNFKTNVVCRHNGIEIIGNLNAYCANCKLLGASFISTPTETETGSLATFEVTDGGRLR